MAIEMYPRKEIYPAKEVLLKKHGIAYDNLSSYVKKDGICYPVNATYVVKQLTMSAAEKEVEQFSGEIYEYFNLSPWGYYSDNTSYCVVHGKPGDVIEISMLFAHTELANHEITRVELDGSSNKFPAQEYVYAYINPDMWYYEDFRDGTLNFEAPAGGTGTPYTHMDSWNRITKSIGETYTGFAATANNSMWVDRSIYNTGHQMGGFDEFVAIETELAGWDASIRNGNYLLGIDVTMGANIIRPYEYTNKKKDTILWIYETTATYNGIPIEEANTNPFAYAGRLNIKASGIADDTPFSLGINQRGSRLISEKFKYAPWERYPEL